MNKFTKGFYFCNLSVSGILEKRHFINSTCHGVYIVEYLYYKQK